MVKETLNPFEIAQKQIKSACDKLNADPAVYEIDLCDILQSVVYTNMEFNLIQDNEELNDVKKVTGKIEMKFYNN